MSGMISDNDIQVSIDSPQTQAGFFYYASYTLLTTNVIINHANILFCCGLADYASGEDEGDKKTRGRDHLQCLLLPDGWSRQLS